MMVKVRKEVVRCDNCKCNNVFLYLSDYAYGERLVLYNNEQNYAYLNLYKNNIFDEFVDCIQDILRKMNKDLDDIKIQEIVNSIFNIACDKIEDSEISLCKEKKCIDCDSMTFEDLLVEPEIIETVDIPIVTHDDWTRLSHEQRYDSVYDALKKYFK